MDIAAIFQDAHANWTEGTLIPIILIDDEEIRKIYGKRSMFGDLPFYKDIEESIQYSRKDIDNFYITGSPLSPFCYFDGIVMVEICKMDLEYFKMFKIKECIEQKERCIKRGLDNNQYESIFSYVDDKVKLMVYNRLFEQIPDNQKFDIFRDIYMKIEYGFETITPYFLDLMCQYRTKECLERIDTLPYDNEGFVKIYRGQGSLSADIEEAFSWTIDIDIAKKFANRFDSQGKVYKAKIHKADILDYIPDRGESEVILLSESLENIEEV